MSLLRLIARLDVKGPNVVKGVMMEGLRVVGDPEELACRYAQEGADELLYLDIVASLYGRNQLADLLERTTAKVFIPVCVGGGISGIAEVQRLLDSGADKVAVNTAAIRNPRLISDIARRYGSQAICVSIEAKKTANGWEAYTDNGRERSGRDACVWAQEAIERGAGEILLTSVDCEGTRKGFDTELVREIAPKASVPVIACGGMGAIAHAVDVIRNGKADAIAFATCLHYNLLTIKEIRDACQSYRQDLLGQGSENKKMLGMDGVNSQI